jgi:hypothetical protein
VQASMNMTATLNTTNIKDCFPVFIFSLLRVLWTGNQTVASTIGDQSRPYGLRLRRTLQHL